MVLVSKKEQWAFRLFFSRKRKRMGEQEAFSPSHRNQEAWALPRNLHYGLQPYRLHPKETDHCPPHIQRMGKEDSL